MVDSALSSVKMLGLAVAISAPWGAVVGLVIALTDGHSQWYQGVAGGFILGPAMVVLFETPLRKVFLLLNSIHWTLGLISIPFIILRWLFAMVPVWIANGMAQQSTTVEYETTPRAKSIVATTGTDVLGFSVRSGDVIFSLEGDNQLVRGGATWGSIEANGSVRPQASTGAASIRYSAGRLLADGVEVGVLS